MKINYYLNMSVNAHGKDGKRTWVKKTYEKETVEITTLEALRDYLDEKRKRALDHIPEIEETVRNEYGFTKHFKVVATYPRVFTSPKRKQDDEKNIDCLISYKVIPLYKTKSK